MLLKGLAGLLVAVAVVLTGAALTGYHGHCPFSSGCCDRAAPPGRLGHGQRPDAELLHRNRVGLLHRYGGEYRRLPPQGNGQQGRVL